MNPDLEQLEQIKNATKATPEFSLDGMTCLCKVVDVYDGDSIKVVFFVNNILYRWSLRLFGINTPELRPSRSIENRDEIIQKAKESRDFLKNELEKYDNMIYIKCHDFDKYGRVLAEIFPNKTLDYSFNQMLLDTNHAVVYED